MGHSGERRRKTRQVTGGQYWARTCFNWLQSDAELINHIGRVFPAFYLIFSPDCFVPGIERFRIHNNPRSVASCSFNFTTVMFRQTISDVLGRTDIKPFCWYAMQNVNVKHRKEWWAVLDSNQWPHGCEPCALTSWANCPRKGIFNYQTKLKVVAFPMESGWSNQLS